MPGDVVLLPTGASPQSRSSALLLEAARAGAHSQRPETAPLTQRGARSVDFGAQSDLMGGPEPMSIVSSLYGSAPVTPGPLRRSAAGSRMTAWWLLPGGRLQAA